ncbi:P-loop containing nucleoside triphosphate hydrolase protein [Chytriomyces sp. MP71]|nr:P-loop containing nucleoside triphosphate hydrolase protein [Chytriomyces sp. MP71]
MEWLEPFCADSSEGAGPWSRERAFDLTPCFEDTTIALVPPLLLAALGLLRLWTLRKRPRIESSWSYAQTAKSGLSLLLAAAVGAELGDTWISQDKYLNEKHTRLSNQVAIVAYVFASVLHFFEHARSRVGSTTLLFFWLFSILANSILLRTAIITDYIPDSHTHTLFVQLVVAIPIFVLENWPRPAPTYRLLEDADDEATEEDESPEQYANIFSRLTFHWMDGLMKLGYSKDLEMEDLWALRIVDGAKYNSGVFSAAWNAQLRKGKPSLLKALAHSYGLAFGAAAVFKALQDMLQFIQPTFLRYIMEFTNSWAPENKGHEQPLSRGFSIAVMMLLCAIIQTFLLHQYFHTCIVIGMRVKAAVITAIYQKALRLSPAARQKSTVGEIVNLMSVDAGRIGDLTTYFHIIWSGPLQICLALYFLYYTLGVSIFAGVAIMLIMIPINGTLASYSRRLNKIQMGNKDKRTKLMDELLNGIKVIKLYAWEKPFLGRVNGVRELELATLKRIGYLSAGTSFTWVCTPLLVSFMSFALYCAISDEPLTSTKVFVSMSLFNLLQFPLSMFPSVVTAIIDASVSFTRLFNFLMNEEIDADAVINELPHFGGVGPIERAAVQRASFRWVHDSPEPILKDVNLRVHDGELLAVVGVVGSGKSSLLSALLGEMYKEKDGGSVHIRGTIAYVPQTSWIMNDTLRNNITFGNGYDLDWYNTVIAACGLMPDLEILPGGDATEIGERGINLSGGQKQRISLARAVYSKADIYLLDDTLSAVDAHVGRHIFDHVIGPNGLLAKKARVFVTHGIHVLPETDYIAVMMGGEVIESGPYKELMGSTGSKLSALMREYGKRKDQSGSSDMLTSPDALAATGPAVVAVAKSVVTAVTTQAGIECVPDSSGPNGGKLVKGAPQAISRTTLTVKEESAKGSVSGEVYLAYARSCGMTSIILFILNALFSQFLSIVQNLYLADWAASNDRKQNLVLRGIEPDSVIKRLSVYGGIGLIYAISFVFQTIFVWIYCGIRSARILHNSMLENVMHLPQSYFDTTPLGRILNRFSKDVYTVDEVLPRVFQGYTRTLFTVFSVLVINTIGNWVFVIFVIPLSLLYIYFQRYYLSTSRELKRLDSTSRSPVYAHFQETLAGVSTIRAYGQPARFIKTNEYRVDYNMRAYYPSVSSNRWLAVRLEFIGSLIVFGSALFAVGSVALYGSVNASLVGLALTYALSVTQSLNWMVRQSCEIETNIVSVERMKEYIDLPQEAPYEIPARKPHPTWPEHGEIEFKGYQAKYRPDLDLVLKGLDFKIHPNEKIGIVGRTGAGKSSLTLALFRIIEAASGSISLDHVDISKIGLYDLRSKMTIIPQDAFVFHGTVRENLDPFNKESDDALWDALAAANLKEVIARMEGGLDAAIQQGGENLSSGQRQLLCLARAVLRKSKVLVLDEATAAIDYETDNIIQRTIRELARQSTIITIAHRINTIIDYDRILVLDQGVVSELDTPQNLLNDKKSKFYSLAREAGLAK